MKEKNATLFLQDIFPMF